MSALYDSPFKKPECGDLMHIMVKTVITDVLGGLINFQVVGTDPDTTQPIDGAAMTEDYVPAAGNVNPDKTFFICIETAAASYAVVLADGTPFTITPTQSTAYLGLWYPARIIRVLEEGTTGNFSVGY